MWRVCESTSEVVSGKNKKHDDESITSALRSGISFFRSARHDGFDCYDYDYDDIDKVKATARMSCGFRAGISLFFPVRRRLGLLF